MATPKKYHHGDLRRKLLETALQIISEEGLENISMRKLGQRLDVSRAAPYSHFLDKSHLLCAIAEAGFKKLTNKINKANSQLTDNPLIRLKKVGFAYVEFAIANPVHYRLMFGNEIVENKRTPELVKLAEEAFNGVLLAIKTCQNEKLIRDLHPYMIANALWSMSHGISTLLNDGQIQAANAFKSLPALIQKVTDSGKPDIKQIIDYITDILMYGFIK